MKAVTRDRYGLPKVLKIEELETPIPKSDELLIRVRATTVNRTDTGILTGNPFVVRFFTGLRKPTLRTPGTDFAGEVMDVGPDVSKFQPGDRVWGFHDEGLASQAQYMIIRQDATVRPIPEGIPFDQAVASIEGAHYALNFLKKISFKPNQDVLINGATGAIGTAILQLLNQKKLNITVVANSRNFDLMKSLGAQEVIDYEQELFTEREGPLYDVILDAVGKSSFGACKHLLRKDGIYISSELGPRIENTYLPAITKIKGGKRVYFPFPTNIPRSLELMSELLAAGAFKPIIDRTYDMDDIQDAYRYVLTGQKTGNVVIHYDS